MSRLGVISLHKKSIRVKFFANERNDLKNIFDKCFIKQYHSYQIGLCKPDEATYQYILIENNLLAKETLFIDDSEGNLLSANKIGMYTLLFDNTMKADILLNQIKNFATIDDNISEISLVCSKRIIYMAFTR